MSFYLFMDYFDDNNTLQRHERCNMNYKRILHLYQQNYYKKIYAKMKWLREHNVRRPDHFSIVLVYVSFRIINITI